MDEKFENRIKEAVGVIGRFLYENQINFDEQNIADELLNLGFNEKEIAGAYSYIEKSTLGPRWRINNSAKRAKTKKNRVQKLSAIRILSELEANKIDNKAHAYLQQLHSVGAINVEMMEEILEHALGSNEDFVTVFEIRRITALLLFTRVQMSHGEGSLSVSNNKIH